MKIDCHIHGEFSSDSNINMQELIDKAIKLEYEYLCFTEHFDLLAEEIVRYGILPLKKYQKRIYELRDKNPQIEIGFGLEIGEPHRTKELRDQLLSFVEIDYLIGSLHLLKNQRNLSTPIDFPLQEDLIVLYYEELIEIVEKGGFDTLGHLGIFKREIAKPGSLNLAFSKKYVEKIFGLMIKKGICLEVNYSGYRSPYNSHLPEIEELMLYKTMGGELITIGSDSHYLVFFDKYYDQTIDNLLNCGFDKLYYMKKRNWQSIKLRRTS